MARYFFSRTGGREVEQPTVNLTPLIDVVFVILIIFILIAPLLEMENIELADASQNPKDYKVMTQEAGPFVIHVTRDNAIIFNKQPVSAERLTDLLREGRKLHSHAIPQVFHDKNGSFGTYQSVKNAIEAAGFEEMDIVLKPL